MSYWVEYTIANVRKEAGCYVVFSSGRPVYVGQATNIQNRFASHCFFHGYGNTLFTKHWGQITHPKIKIKYSRKLGDFLMWEYRLIQRLQPQFNRRGIQRRGDVGKTTSLPALRKGLADRPKPAAML